MVNVMLYLLSSLLLFQMLLCSVVLVLVLATTTTYSVTGDVDQEVTNSDSFHLDPVQRRQVQRGQDASQSPQRKGDLKRAPMRFGKRVPIRKLEFVTDPVALDAIEFLRSARAPVRFSTFTKKAPMRFGKRAPMRFGKRAPMRFGKRDIEEAGSDDDELYNDFFHKRAPMRFGKRSDYSLMYVADGRLEQV